MKRKNLFCLWKRLLPFALWALSLMTFAQNITVKGTVTDELGEPLIGVTVQIQGTGIGTTTGADGDYSLANVPRNGKLEISYVGMKTQIIDVNGRTTINITLQEDSEILDEVVVVGYGTQRRREITGSVANVTSEDFNQGLTRDASDLLQGKVAGLMINSGSGDVTSSSPIRLRGITTLQNDSGPLIVIDGVPDGDLNTVSPSDIESISVLKDATSAAIYGSRAAGGVVLITTKKGAGGKTSVNYDAYLSIDKLATKPDLMNADQWRAYAKYANLNPSIYDSYNADTDWFAELTRTGISQNHNLSLAGGTSTSNYRASYTYQDRQGIMRDNSMQSHNFRFQIQQRAIDNRLRIGLTGSVSLRDMELPERRNYVLAYSMLPVYPVYNADGTYFTKVNSEFDQGNPVQNQNLNSHDMEMVYFYGSGDVQFELTEGLNLKANLYKSRFSGARSQFNDSRTERGQSEQGFALKSSRIWNRNLMEWTLDYDKTLGDDNKHKVQGLLGYSWEDNTYSYFRAQNRNFLSNSLAYNALQTGNGLKTGDVESGKNAFTLISMFARGFYGYDERYMVTAMVRRDGSSKFGKNNKWGIFPSISTAWGISNEAFMKEVTWVDELKLRAGYGVTGNQTGLDPYRTLQLYGMSGIYYDNGSWRTGYAISQNENPNLKWESTATANIGVDFSFLKNRVSGSIEWYNKKTYDMLYTYAVPTPPYVYGEMMANVGDMVNTGVEVLLNLGIIRKKDFSWNMTLNGSYNKNKITRLSNDVYQTDRIYTGDPWIRGGSGVTSHVVEVGRPVGQFFMLECNEINADGKYVFTDINGDGNIDDSDRTYAGTALPDVLFGWNNSLRYKNWDFSVFFRGSIGNEVFNNPLAGYGNNTYLIGTNALNTPLVYQLKGQSSQICSYYVEDASFVRLDNMSLGYTFNTNKIGWLNKARIYLAAQNLFVITRYSGLDPEVEIGRMTPGSGMDSGSGLFPGIEYRDFFPKSRTFTVGFNLIF